MTDAARVFGRGTRARPFVYGHRGTRRGAPENTLLAMRMALAQGAEGIELDVRLCKSGQVIVLHDPDLQRVAGAAVAADQASFAQLSAFDLGEGARVPLLDDALALVLGAGARLNVELKADVPDAGALVRAVVERVRTRPASEQRLVIFSSFDAGICSALVREAPEVPVGFLCSRSLKLGPAGTSALHPRGNLLDARAVERLRAAGLLVNAWTINDATQARELAALGVDGIITDDVPLVLAALAAG